MLRSRPADARFIPSQSVPAKVAKPARKETTVNQVDALNKRIAALEKLLIAQVKPVPAPRTARTPRAATPAKPATKETTPVMRQTVTTFLSAFRPNQATPTPVAVAPVVEAPAVPVAAEYVRTAVKLTNFGHGRRETTIDGTKVGITWTGTTFAYFCGKRRGTAADRGDAIASLNVLLSENGLGAVRA